MLLLIKNHTDTLIEQTKTKPQETLKFTLNTQVETFPFNPLKTLLEGGKWVLGVTSSKTTNSILNITDENNSF